jgi:hypothetical protein
MTLVMHNVFFTLEDKSDAAKQELVDDCRQYLSSLPGMVFLAAGVLAADVESEVNDQRFDVSLHCVFRDKAALDAYMDAPKHLEFLEKHGSNWQEIRAFDSYISDILKVEG